MVPAVPVGAAGEKFLKFDTFSCILRQIFAFFSKDIHETFRSFDMTFRIIFF